MSKKYIRIILLVLMCVGILSTHAQLPEKGDYRTRVGIKAPNQIQYLMKEVFENPPFKDPFAPLDSLWHWRFYENFKKLTDYAPYADYTFYSGAFSETQTYIDKNKTPQRVPDGTSIFERWIESFPDTAMKMLVVEDILALNRHLIDDLDSINVLRNNSVAKKKSADDTLSMPVAMTMYAHLYYKYAGNPKYYPAHLYDKELARENYRKAFKMLVDNNIDPGEELQAVFLNEYYRTCEDLFKINEEKYYEQFLQDYLDIVQVCDNLIIPYYNIPDEIKNDENNSQYAKYRGYNYWTNHNTNGIKALFNSSGAATQERLSRYYLSQLSIHRRDSVYLNTALNVLNENGCSQTEAFYSYSKASYAIRPTYLNCIGSAFASKVYNMRDDMIKYFEEAYKLAGSNLQRGIIAYQIGHETNTPIPTVATKEGGLQTQEYLAWVDNMNLAQVNLKKVLMFESEFQNSSKIAIREIPARTRFALAQNLYRLRYTSLSIKEMYEAADYLRQAMQQLPKAFSAGPGLAKDINDRILKLKEDEKDRKLYKARVKAHEEYLKKKKAEEDFWNQK